jgi:hypothetical protein
VSSCKMWLGLERDQSLIRQVLFVQRRCLLALRNDAARSRSVIGGFESRLDAGDSHGCRRLRTVPQYIKCSRTIDGCRVDGPNILTNITTVT